MDGFISKPVKLDQLEAALAAAVPLGKQAST
jgi:hypothetical protein